MPWQSQAVPLPDAIEPVDLTHVRVGGRQLVYFGGCDYYRLSLHPGMIRAHNQAADKDGLSIAASRMTTGNHPAHIKLEDTLANFFGAATATVVSSGYLTNLAVGHSVHGRYDQAFLDQAAHTSLQEAARIIGCPVTIYRHCDVDDLARKFQKLKQVGRILLMTDGVFGATGKIAPLAALTRQLRRNATLWVDDAHGAGVLGDNLRGSAEAAGIAQRGLIRTISFSKAMGVQGGAILGPAWLRKKLLHQNPVLIGSTVLPPSLAAAAMTSLRILKSRPTLAGRLRKNIARVKEPLAKVGLPVGDSSFPVLPVGGLPTWQLTALRRRLLDSEIHPPFIRYSSGSRAGFFRFAISSRHTAKQLEKLLECLRPLEGVQPF